MVSSDATTKPQTTPAMSARTTSSAECDLDALTANTKPETPKNFGRK